MTATRTVDQRPFAPRRGWLEPDGWRRVAQLAQLAAIAGLLLVTAGVVGASVTGGDVPGDASAEAGFARDMQVHHAQAVGMAMTIRDRSHNAAIRTLGYDVALTQQQQIGEMHGWLTQWGLSQTSSLPAMAWMTTDESGMAGMSTTHGTAMPMPGMATTAQLNRLQRLRGRPAEVLFLTLTVRHHRGGVAMAKAVIARTDRPEVRELARTMVTAQTREIAQMQQLLKRRGAKPA